VSHTPVTSGSTLDLVRTVVLLLAGIAALVYALWPPNIEAPYLTVAGALLGADPVIRAAKG
jgi:hypothetical protein